MLALTMPACASLRSSLRRPLADGDFAFVLGVGSGVDGFSILRVAHDGSASYLFRRGNVSWRVMRFSLEPAELAELRALVDRQHVFEMQDTYRDPGVVDGAQSYLKVRVGDARKLIYCDGRCPTAITAIADFVENVLLPPRSDLRASAPVVSYADAREDERLALP
jgi:hypothetical protein